MIKRIFLDMDGVLADFEGEMANRGISRSGFHFGHKPQDQWTPDEAASDAACRVEMAKSDFWPSLKLMAGARELLAVSIGLVGWDNVRILTALPRFEVARPMVETQKREWCVANLGLHDRFVITCLRAEKRNHAAAGYVLVDDLDSNCNEWVEAGGIGLIHQAGHLSIAHLMGLHNRVR
jgi:hypothetical protein